MEQTSDLHAASLTWLLGAPGRGQDSAELVFFFQAVTHWTVSVALRWTCRPTGCQKYFSLVAVGEPSALTSSGLAATTVSVNASLALKCMLLPCLQEVF